MDHTSGFWNWLVDALGSSRYSAHSICLTNDPVIILLYVVSDLTTAASYFLIGLTLYWSRNATVSFSPVTRALFGVFIFLCGLSHFTETLTLFTGIYRLDVVVTGAMAAVSVATAITTFNDVTGRPIRAKS